MGRPEPCVLFAQSFVHPYLDEYVDEVRFTEPVVITACEVLEQNASASCPSISLSGASWPQSFALEFFVQCEGESRFRRLCQAFLYSPSSSSMLEVQPVVTNHLVIRGSYRVLSLVIYGNTAEELGQYNVEFDLDNSLANLCQSAADGKIEDLPLPLQAVRPTFEESISCLKNFCLVKSDYPEVKDILYWSAEICKLNLDQSNAQKLVRLLLSAATSFLSIDVSSSTISGNSKSPGNTLVEVKNELLDLYKRVAYKADGLMFVELDSLDHPRTNDLAFQNFQQWFDFDKISNSGIFVLSQTDSMIGGLTTMQLLCTDIDGCHLFVKADGMQYVTNILKQNCDLSTATTLMSLAVIEHACRFGIGCEAFLGSFSHNKRGIEIGCSNAYSTILKLLMKQQRHDIGCHAIQILQRLHAFEILVSFESVVLPLLEPGSSSRFDEESNLKSLILANAELKKLLKFFNSRDSVDDPSPVGHANRLLIVDQEDGSLPYKATISLIHSSKYRIIQRDIDPYFLSILKERGFIPLLAALLSSPFLRSASGSIMDAFIDVVAIIEAVLLSFLLCRSGLLFLLSDPDAVRLLLQSLRGTDDKRREEFLSLRYASVLISKGFFCPPKDVGMIIEESLKVVCAIDRVIGATPHSEDMLWALWDLCSISRSDIGRQAVLSVSMFPEVISILMDILQSGKESEQMTPNISTWPSSLAIFHAAAELFEVMVTDATACTLSTWLPHAIDLHRALHSSSLGSSKKDAPARLLDWVDAALVYCKKGVIGLLRYSALLASGGDAQLTSTSLLVSESVEMDSSMGDNPAAADFQPVEILLGKLVSEKLYDGITLPDSSIPQLTTAMRILAFVAEHSGVAACLYEEGAVTVLYAIIMNCAFMLERSSNTYDYLVDDGAECNTTAELLLERSRERQLVEMLLPSLSLLLTLLRKLQEAGEQHHNTRLLNALLRLHREISPKLASRTADLLFTYASSTLALGAVSHLIVSCLACWPVFGWTPGLFQRLLENVPAPTTLALGPKEACSVLCLLGDLFPEEGIWLWKNSSSSLTALKTLGIGTRLGLKGFAEVDWYLQSPHFAKLLGRLVPHLDKVAEIVLHLSCTTLVVLQDMLRVLIIRIACQKSESAVALVRPLLVWMQECLSRDTYSDMDVFKMGRLTEFLAGFLEHPITKRIFIKEGLLDIWLGLIDKIIENVKVSGSTGKDSPNFQLQCCSPIFRSFSLLCDPSISVDPMSKLSRRLADCPNFEGFCRIILCLLKFCVITPVGKELQVCWDAITTIGSHVIGRSAFAFVALHLTSASNCKQEKIAEFENVSSMLFSDWLCNQTVPPFMSCWQKLVAAVEQCDGTTFDVAEIIKHSALAALFLCEAGKSVPGMVALKCLFGCEHGLEENPRKENKDNIFNMIELIIRKLNTSLGVAMRMSASLDEAKEAVMAMRRLLEKSTCSIKISEVLPKAEFLDSEIDLKDSYWELPPHLSLNPDVLMRIEEESAMSNENIKEPDKSVVDDTYYVGNLPDRFMWECPDSTPDRVPLAGPSLKRKAGSLEGSNRRQRVEGVISGVGVETTVATSFVRTGGANISVPTRRDTFRQRKPNTSRPPSMHVDDYVARERNDGTNSTSNVVGSQRGGSTGGRPPSIHVDEFMARQRERQQTIASTNSDPCPVQSSPPESGNKAEKAKKPKNIKTHLDDDLHEINIELDLVPESDDVLNFPHAQDILQSANMNVAKENSPDSVADDADMNTNVVHQPHLEPKARKVSGPHGTGNLTEDRGQTNTEASGEVSLTKDHPEKKSPNLDPMVCRVYESAYSSSPDTLNLHERKSVHGAFQTGEIGAAVLPSIHDVPAQSQCASEQIGRISQGQFDHKGHVHAPPLPPLPPPPGVPPALTHQIVEGTSNYSKYIHSTRDCQPPLPSGSPYKSFDSPGVSSSLSSKDYYAEGIGGINMGRMIPPTGIRPLSEAPRPAPPLQFHIDHPRPNNFGPISSIAQPRPPFDALSGANSSTSTWFTPSTSRPSDDVSISGRPPPPLPPTPPPFPAPGAIQASSKIPVSQSLSALHLQTTVSSSFTVPSASGDKVFGSASQLSSTHPHSSSTVFVPPLPPGRPTTVQGNLSSNLLTQQSQIQQGHSQHVQLQPQTAQRTLHQPSQTPQPPLPPQLPHHTRPLQTHQPAGQGPQTLPSVNQANVQLLPQPPAVPQSQPSQATSPNPLLEHQQAQHSGYQHQHIISAFHQQQPLQQQEPALSLQHYFSSPEAIQALLSDQDKLRQLLEQHPKLMQMLQERLSQL